MKHRFWLALLLFLLPASLVAAPKNVVMIVADDLGCDTGCYGNKVIKTPNIDKLAADGTRFTHAYCTTASCSASRSVILTGKHNHANGQYGHAHSVHHFSLNAKMPTLPALLREAGYRTGHVGKLHVEPENAFQFDTMFKANPRNGVQMVEVVKAFLAEKSDKPFFLYFCPTDPHRDGQIATEIAEKPNRFGNPGPMKSFKGITEVTYDPKEVIVPPFLPDTAACRAELAQYYQSVSRLDQGVGAMIQVLKDAGKYDETLILFLSDNGIAMPGAKTTLYDPGMRLPLIVRHPETTKKGLVNNAMISWVDLAPTIMDFAGAKVNAGTFHGRSFLPILGEESPKGWDEVHASHTFHEITMYYPMRVIQNRTHKLIWNIAHPLPFPFASDLWEAPTWQTVYKQGPTAKYGQRTVREYIQRPRYELYDLSKDPNEIHNLADDPKSTEIMKDLSNKMKAFQKATSDPWVLKWEYE